MLLALCERPTEPMRKQNIQNKDIVTTQKETYKVTRRRLENTLTKRFMRTIEDQHSSRHKSNQNL